MRRRDSGSCSSAQTSTPRRPASAPSSSVVRPLPHSSTGPSVTAAKRATSERKSRSAAHRSLPQAARSSARSGRSGATPIGSANRRRIARRRRCRCHAVCAARFRGRATHCSSASRVTSAPQPCLGTSSVPPLRSYQCRDRTEPQGSRVAPPQHQAESRPVAGVRLTWPCSCCSQPRMSESTPNLDRSLAQGIAWRGGIRWFTQLVSWAATLMVARLITPTDYGLFAMAMVYAGCVQLVNELGLSLAIVQRRDLTEEQIAQLGGLTVLASVALFVLSVGLAGPIASFFGERTVRGIIIALSPTFVMRGVQVVPRSLLARDLEFRRLAWIDAGEAVLWSSTTLVGAFLGLRYWALAWGAVVRAFAVMGCLGLLGPP